MFDGTPTYIHLHRAFASLSGVCFFIQASLPSLREKLQEVGLGVRLFAFEEVSLVISLTQVLIWIVIAAVVGFARICILIASCVPFLGPGDGDVGDGRFRP